MAKAAAPAPPKGGGGKKFLIIVIVVGLLAVASGATVPILLSSGKSHKEDHDHGEKKSKEPGRALITFGPTTGNLAEGRLTRAVLVKPILVVDDAKEKEVNDLLVKKKPFMKSWLISYLSDRTIEDLRGSAGTNRMRREIRDNFNAILCPDGSEKIIDILFEDVMIQ